MLWTLPGINFGSSGQRCAKVLLCHAEPSSGWVWMSHLCLLLNLFHQRIQDNLEGESTCSSFVKVTSSLVNMHPFSNGVRFTENKTSWIQTFKNFLFVVPVNLFCVIFFWHLSIFAARKDSFVRWHGMVGERGGLGKCLCFVAQSLKHPTGKI